MPRSVYYQIERATQGGGSILISNVLASGPINQQEKPLYITPPPSPTYGRRPTVYRRADYNNTKFPREDFLMSGGLGWPDEPKTQFPAKDAWRSLKRSHDSFSKGQQNPQRPVPKTPPQQSGPSVPGAWPWTGQRSTPDSSSTFNFHMQTPKVALPGAYPEPVLSDNMSDVPDIELYPERVPLDDLSDVPDVPLFPVDSDVADESDDSSEYSYYSDVTEDSARPSNEGEAHSSIFTTVRRYFPHNILTSFLYSVFRLPKRVSDRYGTGKEQIIRAEPVTREDGCRKKILLDAGLTANRKTPQLFSSFPRIDSPMADGATPDAPVSQTSSTNVPSNNPVAPDAHVTDFLTDHIPKASPQQVHKAFQPLELSVSEKIMKATHTLMNIIPVLSQWPFNGDATTTRTARVQSRRVSKKKRRGHGRYTTHFGTEEEVQRRIRIAAVPYEANDHSGFSFNRKFDRAVDDYVKDSKAQHDYLRKNGLPSYMYKRPVKNVQRHLKGVRKLPPAVLRFKDVYLDDLIPQEKLPKVEPTAVAKEGNLKTKLPVSFDFEGSADTELEPSTKGKNILGQYQPDLSMIEEVTEIQDPIITDDSKAAQIDNKPLVAPISDHWAAELEAATKKKGRIAGDLTTHDFGTLLPRQFGGNPSSWLNDEIVNEYLKIIVEEEKAKVGYNPKGDVAPPVHAFPSQWWVNVSTHGVDKVKRWSRRPNLQGPKLLGADLVLFPICSGAHWTLLVIRPSARIIEYYDSLATLGVKTNIFIQKAKEWVQMELGGLFVPEEWEVVKVVSKQQLNGSDCGVFTCLNALALVRGVEASRIIPDNGMLDARRQIAATLLNGGTVGIAGE